MQIYARVKKNGNLGIKIITYIVPTFSYNSTKTNTCTQTTKKVLVKNNIKS